MNGLERKCKEQHNEALKCGPLLEMIHGYMFNPDSPIHLSGFAMQPLWACTRILERHIAVRQVFLDEGAVLRVSITTEHGRTKNSTVIRAAVGEP